MLWPYALAKGDLILTDIASQFTILDVLRISWPEKTFSQNLSRFYSSKLPPGSDKERHCGRGPFLLVIVRDDAPPYALRRTSKGPKKVNARMFDARERYRRQTGGGHRVHATLTAEEADHDLFLLLARDADAYRSTIPPWQGGVVDYSSDLVGAHGWHDLGELFRALEVTTHCVALPAGEERNDRLVLLTDNLWDAIMVANGRPLTQNPRAVHEVTADGRPLTLELVQSGAGYLDDRWEEHMLASAAHSDWGGRVAPAEDAFYAGLYARIVRGEPEPEDVALRALAAEAGVQLADTSQRRAQLEAFLGQRSYGSPRWEPPDLDTGDRFFAPLPVQPDIGTRARSVRGLIGRRRIATKGGRAGNPARSAVATAPSEVTAVVISHNTRSYLERCLSELTTLGLRALVVDSASTDGSVEAVRDRFPRVEAIALTVNRGFGSAANEALRRVKSRYVLLLNADAWPRGKAVVELLTVAEQDDRLAAVAPGLVNTAGTAQRSVFGYPLRPVALAAWLAAPRAVSFGFTLWRGLTERGPRAEAGVAGTGGYRLLRPNDFPAGAALLLRRAAVEEIGGFDERFFMYSEETDLCRRLQDRGWRIAYCPDAQFVHVGGAATRQWADEMRREQIVSYLRFMSKHAGMAKARRARRLATVMLRLRALVSRRAERRRCLDAARWLAECDVASLL